MSLNVQQQIRNNAQEVREYIKDLYEWEDVAQSNNKPQPIQRPIIPPPRGQVQLEKKAPQLQRDSNSIKDYYDAWNKFEDNDDPITEVVYQKTQSKPNAQILIKGGKQTIKTPLVLQKEEANQLFKEGKLDEALNKYQECIDELKQLKSLDVDQLEQLVILYSNRSQVYIKQHEYIKAIEQSSLALNLDNNHSKSLLRRCNALQYLGRWKEALRDSQRLVLLGDNEVQSIVNSLKSKMDNKRNLAKQQLKTKQNPENYIIIQVSDVDNTQYLSNLDNID